MLPDDLEAGEYVLILPDWDGRAVKAVGLQGVDEQAGVVLLDRNGRVIDIYQGDEAAEAALQMVSSHLQLT